MLTLILPYRPTTEDTHAGTAIASMKHWRNLLRISSKSFTCGHCGKIVASAEGYFTEDSPCTYVYVCPNCSRPTYFAEDETQVPGVTPGVEVEHLPNDVQKLFREARYCVAIGSYTSAVLSCRKLLMHIAVAQQAAPGKSFLEYVEYLAEEGYIPPNGRGWVDYIRTKGNEANHEIRLMERADAAELISFSEMLLKFIYEFPKRVPEADKA